MTAWGRWFEVKFNYSLPLYIIQLLFIKRYLHNVGFIFRNSISRSLVKLLQPHKAKRFFNFWKKKDKWRMKQSKSDQFQISPAASPEI